MTENNPKRKVTGKTIEKIPNVTEYITVMWYNNSAKGKQGFLMRTTWKGGDDPKW